MARKRTEEEMLEEAIAAFYEQQARDDRLEEETGLPIWRSPVKQIVHEKHLARAAELRRLRNGADNLRTLGVEQG